MDDELDRIDREIKSLQLGFHLVAALLFSGLVTLALTGLWQWWTGA